MVDAEIVADIVLIALGWLVILPPSLYLISEKISLVGVYHTLETEAFADKFVKILCCNFHLSFTFIFCFSIVIRETFDNIEFMDAFVLSLPLTLASLLTLRILSNPSEHIKPRLCCFYASEKRDMIIDQHKERILSFFYSFMGASMIILLIILSNSVWIGAIMNLSDFDCEQYFSIFLVFIFGIGLTTFIGECILKKFPPIVTM